jgi:hypothetical protein
MRVIRNRKNSPSGHGRFRSASLPGLLTLASQHALRALVSVIGACTGDIHEQLQRPALSSARNHHRHLARTMVRPQRKHHHPERQRASRLPPSVLTRLSEDAWDAAAFLDAYLELEAGIGTLIQQLRGPAGNQAPTPGFRIAPAAHRGLLTAPDLRFIIDKPASRLVTDWRR